MANLLFHPRFESSEEKCLPKGARKGAICYIRKVTILIVCRCMYIYIQYIYIYVYVYIYTYMYIYIWAMSSAMFNYWKVIPMNIPISLVKSQQKSPSNAPFTVVPWFVHVRNSSPPPIHPSESPLIPFITLNHHWNILPSGKLTKNELENHHV